MNTENSIKVIIADSQFLIVESLKTILGRSEKFSVLGIAGTKQELSGLLPKNEFAVLITDPQQLDFNGVNDLIKLKQDFPQSGAPRTPWPGPKSAPRVLPRSSFCS